MRMFASRAEGGRALVPLLRPYVDQNKTLVLALPRGGVPVAYQVANELHLPLDVFIVRKLGAPQQPEFALGAIASGGTIVINPEARNYYDDVSALLRPVIAEQKQELERREQLYRHAQPPLDIRDYVVMVIDDGAATGATMRAAVRALRQMGAAAIIVGLPVCAREARDTIAAEADRAACVETPEPFYAVGRWYQVFDQTSDTEVCELLAAARSRQSMTERLKEAHIGSR
jgi:putative phosphoribosyl transferase